MNLHNATGTFAAPTNSTLFAPYERPWIRDEIFLACLTAISLYLTITLAIFECKRTKREQNLPKESSLKIKIENVLTNGSLCLAAVIITLIRCLCEQIELRLGRSSDLACRIYQHELAEVYHVALTCLYILLWVRQLKLYRHPVLKNLSSPLLRFVSYSVILGIIGSSVASISSYVVTFTLIASPVGCVYDLSFPDGPPSSLPGMLLFIIAVVFQTSLLGLVVYPLIKQYNIRFCCSSNEAENKHENVRYTIIRLSICTAICVISDGISSALLIFVHDGVSPISLWANIYTVNLLLNIVAVVCSFADWKERLFPCVKIDYNTVSSNSG